jgi:hypothetical protein
MNKKLLISSVIAVALLSIGLNFENIYNYFVWDVPLSKTNHSQIVYVEKEEGSYNSMFMPTMKNVTYVNDDSIEIIFAKTKFTDFIPNNFEFTKTVHKGDAFISMCRNVVNYTTVYAVILQLTTVNSTFVSFNHYEVNLPKDVECKYPDIIKQSFDIPWILNTQNK